MRPPRPGSRWSARRLRRRAAYATYLASADWYTHRALWYADLEGGTIRRISYPGGNGAPSALVTADKTTGSTPLTVHFVRAEMTSPSGTPTSER